ncbi:hypothetical protein ACOALZ_16380 [Nocardiopsis algeriensis]|uniref:hypothetical protein n=1 Tax=Nocardiopsis algeriensis TaxID=1478215 RepID=UPI003B439F01
MKRVCDIRQVPDLEALRAWARSHGARVRYLGPTLERHPVYAATRGHVTRVAVVPERDPHLCPLVWVSPLENLEEER